MKGLENQTLGRYELIREIGQGSMGTVYLGRDSFALRDVAIKVSNHQSIANERIARRRRKLFFNEAKAASMLQHPNIIATIDAGIEEDMRYLVMEYVPGAYTLARYCDKSNLLPIDNVIAIILRCALGFDYAHKKGIIHRDVKPNNVLLTQDNEVKIADFGIALLTVETESTQVIGTLGSPRYMSPEQVTGDIVSPESDVFALGIVTYELLTGKNPFGAKTLREIAKRITHEAHKPLNELRPDIPKQLEQIVDRTLKKHPAGRYSTAVDLAGDLSLVYDELKQVESQLSGSQRMDSVRALRFFKNFEDTEIQEILAASKWTKYEPGEDIVQEGRLGDVFYVLLAGEVGVACAGHIVDSLGPGTTFGELGLITNRESRTQIVAKTKVTVLKVDARLIDRVSINTQMKFREIFLRSMAERLSSVMDYIDRQRTLIG